MIKGADFLLIGGGLASATAARTLRTEGAEGEIVIVSAEGFLPYHRPPLTKHFLLGGKSQEDILVLGEDYYREQAIEVMLATRAVRIHPKDKVVETDSAGEIRFKKLLIATGCRPRRLTIPGAELGGIYYLRTLLEAEALRQAMAGAKTAVIFGASFIGMELASSFTEKGIEVTIITREDLLFNKLASPEVSQFFTKYYKAQGVELIFKESIQEFRGSDRVESVVTSTGKVLSCDLVAIGLGVTPEVDFLHGSGIRVEDGILVSQYMQTNDPDIYAAGDVAKFFDPTFRRCRRIEHWDNAVKQGHIAAINMVGQRRPYHAVSYFFSDVFDLSFNFIGDTAEITERDLRGSIEEKSFAVLYLKGELLRAMFFLRRPASEAKAAESLILNGISLKRIKDKLADETFPLEKAAVQTVLVLQGGGALGAFECGVVKAMEEQRIYPDIVAGVSIGAFNAVIIAGNPRHAPAALEAFWDELALSTPVIPHEKTRRLLSSWYSLIVGSPNFFVPRWLRPVLHPNDLPLHWMSFYDPSPVKALLRKYVDFKRLKDSPIRLIVSAVNVETAELETFDSFMDTITPEHILASGSLPPGFPWTTIDGKHYWDGGIVSNSPFDQVIKLLGSAGKKVYAVDLYPRKKPLPKDLMEVIARRDEIFYSEKIDKDLHTLELINKYKVLVEEIMGHLEPRIVDQIRHRPLYIEVMGDAPPISITRIVHEGEEGEPPSRDYDFSRESIQEHKEEGYRVARARLEKEGGA